MTLYRSRLGGFYVYFVGVLFYFLGDPRPVKLIILMELWGGYTGWACARCSLTTFNYSLCLEVFLSFRDKNLSKGFCGLISRYTCAWRCVWRFLETQNKLVQWNKLCSLREREWERANEIIYSLQHLVKRVLCCPGSGCDKNSVRCWQARIP